MAMHFTESAALLGLPAAKKLVLMAFADSADKDTRVAIPGFDTIAQWSGLGRSQVYAAITELVDQGYLARRSGGRSGRRAEFYVFPAGGCCPLHGALPEFTEPAAADTAGPQGDSGENPQESAVSGSGQPDPETETRRSTTVAERAVGSGHTLAQPSTRGSGSGSGSGTGSALDRTPSRLPGYENPPTPPDKPGGDCGCGRKRCRACGTSPRAARQLVAVEHAAQLADLQRRRGAVAWCGDYHCNRATRRVFDGDTGMSSKCPACHPDVVVGPAPPEPVPPATAVRGRRSSDRPATAGRPW